MLKALANERPMRRDRRKNYPLPPTLPMLRAMPSVTYTVKHHCVEGWTAVATWTGVPVSSVLAMVEPLPTARYLRFDSFDSGYSNGWDLTSATHPQTILAYALNGQTLPVPHGAPLRLRVERQLGYKQAKFVMRVEAVDSFARFGKGRGGFWPDRGYEWYAGI